MSQDLDPTETQEWLEAFDSICRAQGSERASYILSQLQARATNTGVGLPSQLLHLTAIQFLLTKKKLCPAIFLWSVVFGL